MSNAHQHPPVSRPAAGAADDPATSDPAALDAHGFDPAEFEWRPVPRRPRVDGWTPDVQRAFIEALGRSGLVEQAAREVDRSVKSAYALRNAPGGEAFARAWSAACRSAADRLLDVAFTRAIEGEEIPVYDQDGIRTGMKWRCNTRLTMFLLRAYHPERFGGAERDGGRRDAAAPRPAEPPVAHAVAALAPVTPAEPHRLMPPAVLQSWVLDARRDAAALAANPVEDTERYEWPRSPADHPRVLDRAARRRARREAFGR
ncbi:hypothetical protein [Sphingomonas sp. 1P08PE]|uniref:hypothetical protein n=1 Tax=Sphingomonas sp. 1P08PE TaxID=554122 RepID=UPI00399FDF7A